MKRIVLLAALLLMVAPAHAQLNIKKVGEVPKQMAVLQIKWNWLYSIGEQIYFVSATTNQYDNLVWIKLGETKEEAARREAMEETGSSMMFISHDLDVVRAMCDSILVMKDGELCENNTTEEIFENPKHEYTQFLVKSASEAL